MPTNIDNDTQNTENNSKSENNKFNFDPNSLDQSDNFPDWGRLSGDISKIPLTTPLPSLPYPTSVEDEAEPGSIGLDELIEESNKLNNKRLDISEILQHTIKNIGVKDFRKEADLTEEDKTLQRKHYLILVVQFLNEKAKELNLDIIFKDGKIYMYNSEYWEVVKENEFNFFLGEIALKMGVDKFDAKFFKFKEDLYKQFISESNFKYIKPDYQATLVNLKNGTFEISEGTPKLRNFQKEDFLTYQLPFSYDENAKPVQFLEFLNEVLPEKELQDILAEYIGSIFIRNEVLKFEKALFLYGTGSNGKSVVFDIISALLGNQNFSSYSLESLTKDKDSRAMISDKLLNYSSEMSTNLESDIFKKLVSREPIDARLLYKSSFIMEDYARLMFNCNELPNDIEHTNAFFRRFLIIPFRVTIKEEDQDRQLSQKILKSELPGVFNWMLEGMSRLLTNKAFTPSSLVENEVRKFRRESDSVLCYIDENDYVKSVEDYTTLQVMYDEYKMYCIQNGNKPCANKKFSARLRNEFEMTRKNFGQVVFTIKKDC
jgi:putative DNA primase/helicase